MGTPYTTIYETFLGKIKDYELAELDDLAIEADLHLLLMSSIPFFIRPRINIRDLNESSQSFNETLGIDEINLLATLMKREWFERLIYDTDVIKQKYAESDFEYKSQAAHLNALSKTLSTNTDKEVKNLLSLYSRGNNEKSFDYSQLVGKRD